MVELDRRCSGGEDEDGRTWLLTQMKSEGRNVVHCLKSRGSISNQGCSSDGCWNSTLGRWRHW